MGELPIGEPSGTAPGAPEVLRRMLSGREFAAVLFGWVGTAVPDRRHSGLAVRRRVDALTAAGVHVTIVSAAGLAAVDGQLGARPAGPGRLLLGVESGAELYEVGPDGPLLVHRRLTAPRESSALDRATLTLVQALGAAGLPCRPVPMHADRRRVDLLPGAPWAVPPRERLREVAEALTARLRAHGIADLRAVLEVAADCAARAGLPDARISSDLRHVEIGLTDASDTVRQVLGSLRELGIGPGLVLVAGDEFATVGGVPGRDARLLLPELRRALVLSVGAEPAAMLPPGVLAAGGGPAMLRSVLDEVLLRHRRGRVPSVDEDPAWVLVESSADPLRQRVAESLLTLAAGGIGTRGSLEEEPPGSTPLVLASGVYTGSGPGQHLLPAPGWTAVGVVPPPRADRRVLDLRTGVLLREETGEVDVPLRSLRFAAAPLPGAMLLRVEAGRTRLRPGLPLAAEDLEPRGSARRPRVREGRAGVDGAGVTAAATHERRRVGELDVLDRIAAYGAARRRPAHTGLADGLLDTAEQLGFDRLLAEHRAAWARRWDEVDVRIPDDLQAQLAVRYALFQLWSHTGRLDELGIGSRGLTGTGGSGHVCWDADVFVLPALASIDPPSARAMVAYRCRRLPAARERASAVGGRGARFPWESAADGSDVTPTTGWTGGRPAPVLAALRAEHVTAGVAWGTAFCADWSGYRLADAPAERTLVLETARYWAWRAGDGVDGRAHITSVTGPDRYHETVDDNAYTNVLARWNLRAGVALLSRGGRANAEAVAWRALAGRIVDNHDPRTGRYEQFAGYDGLEPLTTEAVAPPAAAEVVDGIERVGGTQLVEQPDVLLLHHLVPDEVAPGSLVPNLEYYTPRTAHGTPVSPTVTATLLARAGRPDEALEVLRTALTLDTDDRTGSTAAGLHLATLAGVWRCVLTGFAGVRVHNGCLLVDPQLPAAWPRLQVRFRALGRLLRVTVDAEEVCVRSDAPVWVQPADRPRRRVPASGELRIPRRLPSGATARTPAGAHR